MTGLFFLAIVGIWFFITIKIIRFITGKLPEIWWRPVVGMGLFVLILPLPLVDEIVGGRQFEQLCKENSTIHVDRVKAVGKTVYYIPQPAVEVNGTWVRVVLKPQLFVDATTGEVIVRYNELIASGGRLIRMIGISEGGMPLIFRGTCVPVNRPGSIETFKSFGIDYIEPPITKNGELK
jgi:hypothetical protein